MGVRKTIDTNILAFAIIQGHPASEVCVKLLDNPKVEWITSGITVFELFHVLTKIYGLEKDAVRNKIHEYVKSPIQFNDIDSETILSTIDRITKEKMDVNDAYLLEKTLRDGIGVLVTDDKKLQQIAEEEGLVIESPIEEDLKRKIEEWEEKILPEKGLPRILQRIYFWLLNYDLELAKEFKQQTRFFKKVP